MKRTHYIIAIFGLLAAFAASALAQTPLTSLSGDRVDVQGQRGKVVILAIGASWLPLSEKQVEYTNVLAKKYAGRDVVIYFVATDSTAAKSRNYASTDDLAKFSADHKLAVSLLRDSDGAATLKKFGIDQVPSFVILDKQGNRADEPFGGIDPKFDITVPISRVVDRLL
jgi:thiol-disulfide isomerase/thioredoxin